MLNRHLGFHIAGIVSLEGFPFLPVMGWQVAGASAVGFARRTGLTEISDQVFALRHFLLIESQHRSCSSQGQRQAKIGRPHHGTAPSRWIQETGTVRRQWMVVMNRIKGKT